MKQRSKKWWAPLVVAVVLFGGFWWSSLWVIGLGAVGGTWLLYPFWKSRRLRGKSNAPSHKDHGRKDQGHEESNHALSESSPGSESGASQNQVISDAEEDSESLVQMLVNQDRYSLLLRPRVVDNLDDTSLRSTLQTLENHMALVPEGEVVLSTTDEMNDSLDEDEGFDMLPRGRAVHVEPVYLDICPVTNRQFKRFVEDGGYEDMTIWAEEIWSAVLDFVDRTGEPGPKYWSGGSYLKGQDEHPVVGVCWYEAVAYARWSGKRLPSDAEWAKAGCWPVSVSAGNWQQRRFPWGNALESGRANLWATGENEIVSVHEYEKGLSVGGHQQLIGNIWEWTSGAYGSPEDLSLVLPLPMKSIRGGAFDTYFESQATCQFQSGDTPLARKHNIGFRLALGTCDLAPRATACLYEDYNAVGETIEPTCGV